MAYIPPHKRHSKEPNVPSPSPTSFSPSKPQLHHRNSNHKFKTSGGKILYADDYINRWFVTSSNGSVDDQHDPQLHCSVQLKEFQPIDGRKPMIIVCNDNSHKEVNGDATNSVKSPWVSIEEKIRKDLLTYFQRVRSDMCKDGPELNVPRFVIRFGKVLFHSGSSTTLDNVNKSLEVETALSRFKRRFYTSVPNSFIEAVLCEFISKVGLDSLEEKENYYVKVFDKSRPNATISCKCRINKAAGELDLVKIELNELRRMVADVSCLDKSLDLRLLLASKRILTSLADEEKQSLISLIKSGVIDAEVKGGMRWPMGKGSLGDRYTVVGVWHTKAKTFQNSIMKLKLRHADRFDFKTSSGEAAEEASLKIPELTRQLRDETLELNPLLGMVTETLKLLWDNFLSWEGSFA